MITSTVGLTTTVTSNTLDAADQLTGSSARVNGGSPAVTTYGYDSDGNQLGSAGPTGVVTNTYNLQNQLVHVSGPTTTVSYVYDGQGDRLRSYEQSGPQLVLVVSVLTAVADTGMPATSYG